MPRFPHNQAVSQPRSLKFTRYVVLDEVEVINNIG